MAKSLGEEAYSGGGVLLGAVTFVLNIKKASLAICFWRRNDLIFHIRDNPFSKNSNVN